jgi:hypothetical protein
LTLIPASDTIPNPFIDPYLFIEPYFKAAAHDLLCVYLFGGAGSGDRVAALHAEKIRGLLKNAS